MWAEVDKRFFFFFWSKCLDTFMKTKLRIKSVGSETAVAAQRGNIVSCKGQTLKGQCSKSFSCAACF